jgi:site-specific recombinase XerD
LSQYNWESSVPYFEKIAEKEVRFIDIDQSISEDFKAYLRNGPKLCEKRAGIGHMGERGDPSASVFCNLCYNLIRDVLVTWPAKAGITKHITFSCLRHTYATLQLNNGTDIYTVSKMLGTGTLKRPNDAPVY